MQEVIETAKEVMQAASTFKSLSYTFGGLMAVVILKEVFSFLKSWKNGGSGGNSKHNVDTTVDHALQTACLGRLETESKIQTEALIKATSALGVILDTVNRCLKEIDKKNE